MFEKSNKVLNYFMFILKGTFYGYLLKVTRSENCFHHLEHFCEEFVTKTCIINLD